MRAAIYKKYGPPEVIHFADIPKPEPKSNEVLVKIKATTVNRTDTGFRKAEYFIVRFFSGLLKPKNQVLGTEFSGIIETVGANVKSLKIDDPVFGLNTYKFGMHTEYVCIAEDGSIAIKPSNMSFEEAAAVCDGMMLAINYIRKIDFSTNPKILINGAAGSIGSAAVQLANYFGADITAVCGTENLELIKSLGAKVVIDYTKTDFTKNGQLYDVVLDAVGKSSFGKCKKILKPKGVYFSTELGYLSQNIFFALFTPMFGNKKVSFPIPTDSKKDILEFKSNIEEGKYRAIIDKVYSFSQIVEATKYVETGQKTGNVVILLQEDEYSD